MKTLFLFISITIIAPMVVLFSILLVAWTLVSVAWDIAWMQVSSLGEWIQSDRIPDTNEPDEQP